MLTEHFGQLGSGHAAVAAREHFLTSGSESLYGLFYLRGCVAIIVTLLGYIFYLANEL